MEEWVEGNAKSLFVTPAEMIVGKPLDTPPFGELPKPNFVKLGLGQTAPSASISLANFHLLVMSLKAIPHYSKKIERKTK